MSKHLRGSGASLFGNATNNIPSIPKLYSDEAFPLIPNDSNAVDSFDYVTRILTRSDITDEDGIKIQEKMIAATKAKDYVALSESYLDFTKYFYARGKYADALSYLDMGLNSVSSSQNETYSELCGMRGVLHLRSLELFPINKIEEDLNIALHAKRDNPLFLRKRAVLEYKKDQPKKSIKSFERTFGSAEKVKLENLDEVEDYQVFLKNLAQLGAFKKLYNYAKRGLEIKPDNKIFLKYKEDAVIEFAKAKLGKAFWKEAIEILQQRLEKDPNNSVLIFDLANVQAAKGDNALAISNFAKLIKSGRDNNDVHFAMGNVLSSGDSPDYQSAFAHYISVLESAIIESDQIHRGKLNHYTRIISNKLFEIAEKVDSDLVLDVVYKIEAIAAKYPDLIDGNRRKYLDVAKSIANLKLGNAEEFNLARVNEKLEFLRNIRDFTAIADLTGRMLEFGISDAKSNFLRGFACARLGNVEVAYDSFISSATADAYYEASLLSSRVGKTNSQKCALLEKAIELKQDESLYHIALGSAILEGVESVDYNKAYDEFRSAIRLIATKNSIQPPSDKVKKEQLKTLKEISDRLFLFLRSETHYDLAEDLANDLNNIDPNEFPQTQSILKTVAVRRGDQYSLSKDSHKKIDAEIIRKFSARKFDEVVTMSNHMLESLGSERVGNSRERNFYSFMLGKSYSRLGRLNESISALDQIPLSDASFHPDIFYEKGRVILQDVNSSRTDEALGYYRGFLDHVVVNFNASETVRDKKYMQKVSNYMKRIEDDVSIEILRNSSAAVGVMNDITTTSIDEKFGVKSHKFALAKDIYHLRAAEINTGNGDKIGMLDELSKISNTTLHKSLGNFGFYRTVGTMYYEAGDFEKALEFYEKQEKSGHKKDHIFYERKGDIYRALKRPQEAASAYFKSSRLNPNNLNILAKTVEASEEAGIEPPKGYKERIEILQNESKSNSGSYILTTGLLIYGFCAATVLIGRLIVEGRGQPSNRPRDASLANPLLQTKLSTEKQY